MANSTQTEAGSHRFLLALALTLVAAGEMYIGVLPVRLALVVWFFWATAIGLAVARWWALLFGTIPWPLGVAVGLATGRYAFLGEGWEVFALIVIGIGVVGATIGVFLARLLPYLARSDTRV